jgi:hypothetical protein
MSSTTRRLLWTDLDAWHWERLPLPPGVRTAPFTFTQRLSQPVDARATFGPEGLAGTLDMGPFEAPADALIAAPCRLRMALAPDEQGAFQAGVADVLAPGQFIAAGVLTDEQRRRQAIYAELLGRRSERLFPERPMLLAWTRPLDMRFTFHAETQRAGSALVAVPLEIEPTPPSTRVVIPSPFLDYRSVDRPFGKLSAAYGNGLREWIEMRVPSTVCLRFQVPPEVLPIRLDRARLTVRIHAPSREVEALGFAGPFDEADRRPVSVKSWDAPIGTVRVEITDAALLQLDDGGGLLLAIDVGADPSAGADADLVAAPGAEWKVQSVELEVRGETLEPDA